ncbi:pyridoxamine 5'-phosphate oxidase family protein [Novosphingobium sp. JCM 18896]|uniref:pyridoxamine 5'-phosphate oxidase family protein n=1 Tax=Novosphingobium sp. JCM 18896 TaxID=2989731 RepID=UPI0022233C79|nr:TIGR03618 family F420-dependent PPOX class oxidoreductase [Novosphingobium sp. JCM 18896]MCW1430159.1 TIGR03618 family F420-dependent PPOX class oxidoreductase [Novosphingobium sp. JCM 18896]
MAKMRDAIRMNEAGIAALVDECKSLQVATLDQDGAPHLTTVWFAREGEAWLFETYGKSQKVVNLRRNPRVALLIEQGTEYSELRGVSIKGRATIIDDGAELLRLMKLLVARNHKGLDDSEVAVIAESMAEKRVVVSVVPDTVMSWDHRKLGLG